MIKFTVNKLRAYVKIVRIWAAFTIKYMTALISVPHHVFEIFGKSTFCIRLICVNIMNSIRTTVSPMMGVNFMNRSTITI